MNINHDKCPACLSRIIKQVEYYENVPAILFPIEDEKRDCVSTDNLYVFMCDSCHHLFLNDIDVDFNKRIYEVYYYLYPFKDLESMQQIYRDPFDKIFDFFYKGDHGELLEIGCDNTQQMSKFIDLKLHCTAINPGVTKSSKVEFIDGFYEENIITGTFDYIVSRFNLEHVIDLNRFLENIGSNLKQEGLAFVQVPNIEMFLNSNMLNVFAHEHPHYFCRMSMKSLLERKGFELLYMSDSDSPSLICVFKNNSKLLHLTKQLQNNTSTLKAIQLFLQQNAGKNIVLYGAGLVLSGILYSGHIDHVLLYNIKVIDDNPILHGRYMPNTCVRIDPPTECNVDKDTIILLTLSQLYYSKVISRFAQLDLIGVFGINNYGIYKIY